MPLAELLMAAMWICLTAYALFGGADFGGGFWDLIAGGAEKGRPQRNLIEHSIGPIWEANHVWLIFVIILTWTVVPSVFAAVSSTLYIPLTLVALGIIARGSAFAFRKVSQKLWQQRLFGGAFALSSVVTPFFLGTVGGALASERVPPGIAAGDPITSWVNPTSLASGLLAVATTAYLAAVYLTHDARREGDPALAQAFRRKALASGVVTGVLAVLELLILATDAPGLFRQLLSMPALPFAAVSLAAGVASLILMSRRSFLTVRLSAALAVTALLWSWGIGQYPNVLPGLPLADASATESVLLANSIAVLIAGILVIPSLWWLYAIFQRDQSANRH
ncbi:cytochrome d ubiquinol oxidase subunit II [Arthrobacter globiformis]|uniref:cytochrome d ubiquinol oxidase subunit II n=1 Tax=Arthrobacter globiformis TaxID=1665 RepID=UPI0027918075|nr:cytochrome d ubiquinol oxidase subunit II [Arthrobacter globiformis]MDQ0618447.1 cytochrome d ubiquinol oxidase subunit II [Arthrobacter globiformis]